jgi:hypothetical protein
MGLESHFFQHLGASIIERETEELERVVLLLKLLQEHMKSYSFDDSYLLIP